MKSFATSWQRWGDRIVSRSEGALALSKAFPGVMLQSRQAQAAASFALVEALDAPVTRGPRVPTFTEGLLAGMLRANNRTIEWFDLESGRTRASLATGIAPVSCVSLSPDRSKVALGETGPRVRMHALRSGKTVILNGDAGSILSLAWSPDSQRLAVGSFEGSVKLWNVATRREVCTLRGNLSMLTALAFSSDGRHLVTGSVADPIRIWSAPLLIETENRP